MEYFRKDQRVEISLPIEDLLLPYHLTKKAAKFRDIQKAIPLQ
jgi:hypothetical protein